jgi:hypothetical protein
MASREYGGDVGGDLGDLGGNPEGSHDGALVDVGYGKAGEVSIDVPAAEAGEDADYLNQADADARSMQAHGLSRSELRLVSSQRRGTLIDVPGPGDLPRDDPGWVIDARHEQEKLATWLTATLGVVGNQAFRKNELAYLTRQVEVLRAEVVRLRKLNEVQAACIYKLLDNAQEASKRLGRKDWLLVVIGLAANLVVTELVPSLQLLRLGNRAVDLLGHLFK